MSSKVYWTQRHGTDVYKTDRQDFTTKALTEFKEKEL